MGPDTPMLGRVLVSVWRMISLESKAGLLLILGQTLRQQPKVNTAKIAPIFAMLQFSGVDGQQPAVE